tara:strand:- start:667 stop:954 length:288 start_codon:yes stop_codon:yes gene_type:complete
MIPSGVRIFVCCEPQDMRRSFNGLSNAAREVVGEDPDGGALFVFTNKRRNRLKIMWFDGNGHCILYKRVHRSRFRLPDVATIDATQLSAILRAHI